MHMRLGEALAVTPRGSSHGPFVGALVEGMPAGLQVDEATVKAAMALRKTGGTYTASARKTMSSSGEQAFPTGEPPESPLKFTSPTQMHAPGITVSCPTILVRAIRTW